MLKEKGSVFVAVLGMAVILLLLSTSLLAFSGMNYHFNTLIRNKIIALNAAEGGISRAIYELNSPSLWNLKESDNDAIIETLSETGARYSVTLYNNLSSGDSMTGYRGEIVPPMSAQLVSVGSVGEGRFKTEKTIICLAKISYMDTYACASTGTIRVKDGDFFVEGIDSVSTWNSIPGNLHSNVISDDNTIIWNGAGIYKCGITGTASTLSSKDTIHFYNDYPDTELNSIDTEGNTNINLPDKLEKMKVPDNFNSLTEMPTTPDEEGKITLTQGESYKFDGGGNTDLEINGKLILNGAKVYVKNGNLIVTGGVEGSGVISVSGYKDQSSYEKLEETSSVFVGQEVESKTKFHSYFGRNSNKGHKKSGYSFWNDPPMLLASSKTVFSTDVVLTAYDDDNDDDDDDDDEVEQNTNPFEDSDQDTIPGTIIKKIDTGETTTEEVKEEVDSYTEYSYGGTGYWETTYTLYDVYNVTYTKYNYVVQAPASAEITGAVNMDSTNLSGVLFYVQGKLTLDGTDNELVLSEIRKKLVEKIQQDIADGKATASTLAAAYFKDDMEITVTINGEEQTLTYQGIQDWISSHTALRFKTLEEIIQDNSVVSNAFAQFLSDYLYFQGVIYTEGGFEANGKVKVLGGIIVRNTEDSSARIRLNNGAVITCNSEYLRDFEEFVKNPIYAPTAYHEVY